MSKIITIFMILTFLMISSCGENRIFKQNPDFSVDRFPNEVGLEWQYERIDSLHNSIDTVTIRIVDSIRNSAEYIGTVWNLHFSLTDNIESWLVVQVDDTVTFFKDIGVDTVIDYRLVFPMELGSSWEGNSFQFIIDSFEVVDVDSLPYESYPGVQQYNVERHLWGLNHYGYTSYKFVPGVGMVEGYFSEILFGRLKNETWRLINFSNFTLPQGTFTINRFPLNDGIWWDYQIRNNLLDCDCGYDTLHVSIAESSSVTLWTYEYPSYTYQEYTDTRNDTLLFFYFNQLGQPYKGLIFPIEPGNSWSVFHPFDTTTVLGYELVHLPNGMIFDAYHIRTNLICGDECQRIEDDWIVADIGLIKKRIFEVDYNIYGGGNGILIDEIRYLINYYGN